MKLSTNEAINLLDRVRARDRRIKKLEEAIGAAIIDLSWAQIEVNGASTSLEFLDHVIKRLTEARAADAGQGKEMKGE